MLVKKLTNQITDFDNVELELNGQVIEWDDHKLFDDGIITKHFYYKDNILKFMVDYDTLVIYNENIPLAADYYIGYIRDTNIENGFDFHIVEYYADLPDLATVDEGETYIVIKNDNLHRSGTYEATEDTWKFVACLAPSDHGSLQGLSDDDHPQYLTAARGDARYYKKDEYVDGTTAGIGPVKTNNNGKIGALLLNEIHHSTFTHLDEDDHPQYLLKSGARKLDDSYNPDEDQDIATKKYVDTKVASEVGSSESKVKISDTDTTPRYLDEAISTDNVILKEIQNPGDDETLKLYLSPNVFLKSQDTLDDISDGSVYVRGLPVDPSNTNSVKNKMISNAMAYNWDQSIQTNADNIGTLNNLTTDNKTDLVSSINEINNKTDTNANNIDNLDKHTKYADIFITTQQEFEDWFGTGEEYKTCEETGQTVNGWQIENQGSQVNGENIGSGDGSTTSFSGTLNNQYIRKGSLVIHYTIGSIDYQATDDGNGNIAGTHITSGTINYVTGDWSLTFDSAVDDTTNILCDYFYQIYTRVIVPEKLKIYIKQNPIDGIQYNDYVSDFKEDYNKYKNNVYIIKTQSLLSDGIKITGDGKYKTIIIRGKTLAGFISRERVKSYAEAHTTSGSDCIELNPKICNQHSGYTGDSSLHLNFKFTGVLYRVQPNSIYFRVYDPNNNSNGLTLIDDGSGNIVCIDSFGSANTSMFNSGTVNYDTGDVDITFGSDVSNSGWTIYQDTSSSTPYMFVCNDELEFFNNIKPGIDWCRISVDTELSVYKIKYKSIDTSTGFLRGIIRIGLVEKVQTSYSSLEVFLFSRDIAILDIGFDGQSLNYSYQDYHNGNAIFGPMLDFQNTANIDISRLLLYNHYIIEKMYGTKVYPETYPAMYLYGVADILIGYIRDVYAVMDWNDDVSYAQYPSYFIINQGINIYFRGKIRGTKGFIHHYWFRNGEDGAQLNGGIAIGDFIYVKNIYINNIKHFEKTSDCEYNTALFRFTDCYNIDITNIENLEYNLDLSEDQDSQGTVGITNAILSFVRCENVFIHDIYNYGYRLATISSGKNYNFQRIRRTKGPGTCIDGVLCILRGNTKQVNIKDVDITSDWLSYVYVYNAGNLYLSGHWGNGESTNCNNRKWLRLSSEGGSSVWYYRGGHFGAGTYFDTGAPQTGSF